MSKVVYLSYKHPDTLMAGLGMDVRIATDHHDIHQQLIAIKKEHIALVYVSESLFRDAADVFESLLFRDINVVVFGGEGGGQHARQRMKKLLESAIGIKTP